MERDKLIIPSVVSWSRHRINNDQPAFVGGLHAACIDYLAYRELEINIEMVPFDLGTDECREWINGYHWFAKMCTEDSVFSDLEKDVKSESHLNTVSIGIISFISGGIVAALASCFW